MYLLQKIPKIGSVHQMLEGGLQHCSDKNGADLLYNFQKFEWMGGKRRQISNTGYATKFLNEVHVIW